MKAKELRDLLADKPDDFEVKTWLPGSRILLSSVILMSKEKAVLIEGNLDEPSALLSACQESDRLAALIKMMEEQLANYGVCEDTFHFPALLKLARGA